MLRACPPLATVLVMVPEKLPVVVETGPPPPPAKGVLGKPASAACTAASEGTQLPALATMGPCVSCPPTTGGRPQPRSATSARGMAARMASPPR
jgi:hypothetical protein